MASTPGKCRYCNRPIPAGRWRDALFQLAPSTKPPSMRARASTTGKAAEQVNPLAGYG
jgi:hypothetical protein